MYTRTRKTQARDVQRPALAIPGGWGLWLVLSLWNLFGVLGAVPEHPGGGRRIRILCALMDLKAGERGL